VKFQSWLDDIRIGPTIGKFTEGEKMADTVGCFSGQLMKVGNNRNHMATAFQIMGVMEDHRTPPALAKGTRVESLAKWFEVESAARLRMISPTMTVDEKREKIEDRNRLPNGSVQLLSLEELNSMNEFCPDPEAILARAKDGTRLLQGNTAHGKLSTAVRCLPAGGIATRAQKWVRENPGTAALFGMDEMTPKFLYRVGGSPIIGHTLMFSTHIGRLHGRLIPSVVMTNPEKVEGLARTVFSDWGNFTRAERLNTVFWNQIVLPGRYMEDGKPTEDLYPTGHSDFPYLMAKYGMARTLLDCGFRFMIFSNAEEWMWQADPVVISIANELFEKGHHMLAIGVENTNKQKGGGFVKRPDRTRSVVETPRLPKELLKETPEAIYTTFNMLDIKYMAEHEAEFMVESDKSVVVKDVPGRKGGREAALVADGWAGDVFAEKLNPFFIRWPRLNFLGIKDGSHIAGADPVPALGGRTYLHYVSESVSVYPEIIRRLMEGDLGVAEYLISTGYSYLPLVPSRNGGQRNGRSK